MHPSPQANLILALVAQNQNQTLETASVGYGSHFAMLGYRHHVIDMMKPGSRDELKSVLSGGQVAFAYGFAGVGSQFTMGNAINLWTAMRIPYLALWYDHPCYNYRQHIVDSPYVIQGYHVQDHLDAHKKYLGTDSGPVVLLPVRFFVAKAEDCRPFRARENKIIYAKTGANPATLSEKWNEYPRALQEVMWSLVEMAEKDRNLDLADATARLFLANGQTLDNLGLFMGAIAAVDEYIRAWRSDRLARALLHRPAHIVGSGWDYLRQESHQAEFIDAIPHRAYVDRVQQYRIVANSNPLWRDGIHDRAILAFFYGSVSLTDRTEKSDRIFAGLSNYVGFDWQDNLDAAVDMAIDRARDDTADFIADAEPVLMDRVMANTPDYFTEIERAIQMISR